MSIVKNELRALLQNGRLGDCPFINWLPCRKYQFQSCNLSECFLTQILILFPLQLLPLLCLSSILFTATTTCYFCVLRNCIRKIVTKILVGRERKKRGRKVFLFPKMLLSVLLFSLFYYRCLLKLEIQCALNGAMCT